MTLSQAKALAREVLEDDFVLPYFSTEQLAMMKTLEKSICPRDPPPQSNAEANTETNTESNVMLLDGVSGCGITTFFRTLHQRHPSSSQLLQGDMYIGGSEFLDHLSDAFHVRRKYHPKKRVLAPNLVRTLSLSSQKMILVDDLDVLASDIDDYDTVFGVIRLLSEEIRDLKFVISTSSALLQKRFDRYLRLGWRRYTFRQRLTDEEYQEFANRLWGRLNCEYSLSLTAESIRVPEPKFGLDIQDVNRSLRLKLVERFLHQQGAVAALSTTNDLNEYESYVLQFLYT
ncbi:hypothetical protein DCO48_07225 [Pseudomonas sp. SDI]|uniref:hypothetical protein n=1 Tax=Pseudomonas sp. SDI TaxID=2170734 RepID=UPI000DE74082|nr:hypothetical protein [Pseudomonas sp. SDI]PWB34083.1 hypothetical protein DCO48_07225 [Pseudomonas sp. SDI]